mgnify:FL=1
MKNKKKKTIEAALLTTPLMMSDLTWGAFTGTGNVGYYMLYKDLIEPEELDREHDERFR